MQSIVSPKRNMALKSVPIIIYIFCLIVVDLKATKNVFVDIAFDNEKPPFALPKGWFCVLFH
jgi:hypothetical protein